MLTKFELLFTYLKYRNLSPLDNSDAIFSPVFDSDGQAGHSIYMFGLLMLTSL